MLEFLGRHKGEAGIIYCGSRAKTERTALRLKEKGVQAIAFHAGLSPLEKRAGLARFRAGESVVMVATIAFGMGIDRPDVRFVVHLDMPDSPEAYYQQIGRAGRDGEPAHTMLLYGGEDMARARHWLSQSTAPDAQIAVMRQRLEAMIGLAEVTSCRTRALLSCFGENLAADCGHCDTCRTPRALFDGTEAAQKALSAIYRTGQMFGARYVVDVLRGAASDKISNNRHDKLALFGIGRERSDDFWRGVLRQLVARGALRVKSGEYASLELVDAEARPILRGETQVMLHEDPAVAEKPRARKASAPATGARRSHPEEFWVQHTWQVISQVELMMGLATDAASGTRGYTYTKNPTFLVPYRNAQRRLPGVIDELQHLTADNLSEQPRIEEIRRTVNLRMALLAHTTSEEQAHPLSPSEALAVALRTKSIMDHLRFTADNMEAEENRLLIDRKAAAHRSSVRTRWSLAVASFIDFLLIVLMFRYFVHERGLRLSTEFIAGRLDEARADAERNATEVQLLNTTLEQRVQDRTAELATANRELEAFSYSVSHDLRAPLRTIDGFSLALEEDYAEAVDATGRDYIQRVRAGVQRMGQLIDALLQLSRITRAELVREQFDVSKLADTVVANLREENRDRNITFVVEPGLSADADPRLLQVALENLLGNAVKFSSKVAEPAIAFGCDPVQDAYFIRDNGAGFDMQYADRLFTAFNRLHGDKDFKGSGIGLATVARVVHRHHGRIWAESAVGHGATFWFTLR